MSLPNVVVACDPIGCEKGIGNVCTEYSDTHIQVLPSKYNSIRIIIANLEAFGNPHWGTEPAVIQYLFRSESDKLAIALWIVVMETGWKLEF